MPTAEMKRRIGGCGLLVFPLLLVKATGVMLNGPGIALAETDGIAAQTIQSQEVQTQNVPPADAYTEAAAAARIALLENQPFGAAPLYYEPVDENLPVEETDPELDPPPNFVLRAIMTSSRGNTALIDGKACQVNSRIGDSGWVIIEIDGVGRSVTIQDPQTGRLETRTVE